jgi:hypothetical protein
MTAERNSFHRWSGSPTICYDTNTIWEISDDINLKKNLAVSSDNGIHLKQAVKLSNNLEPPQKLNQGWRVCHGLSPGHCVNCYEQLDNAWSPDGETGSRSPTAHHLGIAFHTGSTQK